LKNAAFQFRVDCGFCSCGFGRVCKNTLPIAQRRPLERHHLIWDNYFSGEYVYFAKSNFGNPPGPMPFYYVLALPFYAVGELGYFSLLGIVVFVLLLRFARVPRRSEPSAYC
jgi:hypothetical protein